MRVILSWKSLWAWRGTGYRFFDLFSLSGYYDSMFRGRRLTLAATLFNFEVSLILTFRHRDGVH